MSSGSEVKILRDEIARLIAECRKNEKTIADLQQVVVKDATEKAELATQVVLLTAENQQLR